MKIIVRCKMKFLLVLIDKVVFLLIDIFYIGGEKRSKSESGFLSRYLWIHFAGAPIKQWDHFKQTSI